MTQHSMPTLSDSEVRTVSAFLEWLDETASSAAEKLETVPPAQRPDWLVANIRYWRQCSSAYRWAIQLLASRHERVSDVSIPEFSANASDGNYPCPDGSCVQFGDPGEDEV